MALRAQSIRAAAAMLLLFAAAAIASTTAAPIQLRSCSVPPLNGSLPTWPNPSQSLNQQLQLMLPRACHR
jgi:hypothetical protein